MSLDGNPSGANASTRGPPIRQVVGFHVEGVAASPADSRQGLLSHAADPSAESGGARVSSSPNPVLIPPTFNTAAVRTVSEPVSEREQLDWRRRKKKEKSSERRSADGKRKNSQPRQKNEKLQTPTQERLAPVSETSAPVSPHAGAAVAASQQHHTDQQQQQAGGFGRTLKPWCN